MQLWDFTKVVVLVNGIHYLVTELYIQCHVCTNEPEKCVSIKIDHEKLLSIDPNKFFGYYFNKSVYIFYLSPRQHDADIPIFNSQPLI